MKVYICARSGPEDYIIEKIFLIKENAEKYLATMKDRAFYHPGIDEEEISDWEEIAAKAITRSA